MKYIQPKTPLPSPTNAARIADAILETPTGPGKFTAVLIVSDRAFFLMSLTVFLTSLTLFLTSLTLFLTSLTLFLTSLTLLLTSLTLFLTSPILFLMSPMARTNVATSDFKVDT